MWFWNTWRPDCGLLTYNLRINVCNFSKWSCLVYSTFRKMSDDSFFCSLTLTTGAENQKCHLIWGLQTCNLRVLQAFQKQLVIVILINDVNSINNRNIFVWNVLNTFEFCILLKCWNICCLGFTINKDWFYFGPVWSGLIALWA